ncbi:hypothetical protein [Corynebacterium sp. A21]|uniref:hypothetical protein n=1 Tax=Corynebacterium sp. A21 TaxID=3457318 RepID=UPI003FCF887E
MLKVPNSRKRSFSRFSASLHSSRAPLTPADLAQQIRQDEAPTLQALHSILHHPRSLARPLPTWRPPSKHLPAVHGGDDLTATLTRHRVGPRAKARVRSFGETREPAYVISARLTDPKGGAPERRIAEAWIRALVSEELIDAVHEIEGGPAPTYCWLVDSHYQPVNSPSSLFAGMADAA